MGEIVTALRWPADDAECADVADTVILAGGVKVGGAWLCVYNPAQNPGWGHDDGGLDGESWTSWGPRGMSCGHPTREAAEQVQIAAMEAAR
jgi:hypothetical protein